MQCDSRFILELAEFGTFIQQNKNGSCKRLSKTLYRVSSLGTRINQFYGIPK